jgi:hypothetical protein
MPDPAYYLWEPPNSAESVELSLAAVDKLNAATRRMGVLVESETVHRPLETGGILIGRRLDSGPVVVDDFEELASEHRRGASFTLSPANRANLSYRIQKLTKQGRTVVGYFRSHSRPGMYLDHDDDLLMRQFFSEPWQVALLVKPQEVGGFFLWNDGEIDRRQTALSFPFDSAALATGGHVVAAPVAAKALPVALAVAGPAAGLTAGLIAGPRREWMSLAAAVGIFAVTAAFIPASVFTATGLMVKHKVVRRTAPLVKSRGVATSEGATGQASAAALESIDPPASQPPAFQTPAFQTPAFQPPDESRQPLNPLPVKRAPVARRVVPMPKPVPHTQSVTGPPPPDEQIAMAAAPPRYIAPAPVPVLPKPRPVIPAARPDVSFEPVRLSVLHSTVGHIPLVSKLARNRYQDRDDYIPARPRREHAPAVPAELSRELRQDEPVDLRIRIGKNGDVAQTEVLSRKSDPLFASIAVHAASEWSFEPARVGDKAVPSEMLVHFRFHAQR